jgi:hypothetical protein
MGRAEVTQVAVSGVPETDSVAQPVTGVQKLPFVE